MNRLSYTVIPPLRLYTSPGSQPLRPLTQTIRILHTSRPRATKCQHSNSTSSHNGPDPINKSPHTLAFWTSVPTWKRAAINTFRCLIGCTTGDFSALWILQSSYPHLGMGGIMGASMATGLLTSITLETILLHRGKDRLPWSFAFRTAVGMSFVSMLAMEMVQNAVDYHLTGGVIDVRDPWFWVKAGVSMGAGFLGPLPYNYFRLGRFGVGCH